jgi:hypothetical protein
MDSPEELFTCGQYISGLLANELDDSYRERVDMAHAIACISNCSLRIRKTSVSDETFHVFNKFYGGKDSQLLPFFSITFEQNNNGEQFDVSLGFTVQNQFFVSYQSENCSNCGDQEFCTQQSNERPDEDFNYLEPELMDLIARFSELWAPVLADFTSSFGIEYMYENVGYILDQVFDSWSDIPNELESTYVDFEFNSATNSLVKKSDLCSKDECSSYVDSDGLCYLHEDFCRIHECFSYKDDGPYCYSHAN